MMSSTREKKMADIRGAYASWAYGDADGAGGNRIGHSGSPSEQVTSPIDAAAADKPVLLLQNAERQYRLMLLREREVEFDVMAEAALDGYERLNLQAKEGTARYWIAEDERSASESLKYMEQSALSVVSCSAELGALAHDEEAARSAIEASRIESLRELEADERPEYLAARRRETARLDAQRSRASTPVPLAPAPPTAPGRPISVARQPSSGERARQMPRPPTQVRRDTRLHSLFIIETERVARAAILDGRDAFAQAVGDAMGAMHGAVPTFSVFALESDEDVERRAIAGAYFDMLMSALRVIESLRRREIDLKERRKQLAAYVPRENEAWLVAKQRQVRRNVVEEQNEVIMEQARRDAIHDRERRESAERRGLSADEVNARVEMLHDEASERAVLWARCESEWRELRETEIRQELERQRKADTLVLTEVAHGICIVDERRLRRNVLDDEAAARRDLRGEEMSGYMRARRAEGLNIDVAKSLQRDYDDKAAALAQTQQGQRAQKPSDAKPSPTAAAPAKMYRPADTIAASTPAT